MMIERFKVCLDKDMLDLQQITPVTMVALVK
jgi:hypothetical protein